MRIDGFTTPTCVRVRVCVLLRLITIFGGCKDLQELLSVFFCLCTVICHGHMPVKPHDHGLLSICCALYSSSSLGGGVSSPDERSASQVTLPCAHATSIAHPGGTGSTAKTKMFRERINKFYISLIMNRLLMASINSDPIFNFRSNYTVHYIPIKEPRGQVIFVNIKHCQGKLSKEIFTMISQQMPIITIFVLLAAIAGIVTWLLVSCC